jgi:SagB-type dehydrogenase family enzyme
MQFRDFHNRTGPSAIQQARAITNQLPPATKTYPRFDSFLLPQPQAIDLGFSAVLAARHTTRQFDQSRTLALADLATVLFAGAGIQDATGARNEGTPSRHHPSGGALYPLECYVAAFRIDSLSPALYHYEPIRHALERLPADPEEVWCGFREYAPVEKPAAAMVVTALWDRVYPKYGEFAYRLALIETGHMVQDMLLCAEALGLSACPLAGFASTPIARALDIAQDQEDPLYLCLLGS